MIRILLAEDQAMMRGALAVLLGLEPDLEVVAEVGDAPAVLPAVLREKPDVALLDVEMPGGDGITATAQVRAAAPSCRVLILTTFGRPGHLRRAMEAGAQGFLVKDGPVEALAAAALAAGPSPLTERERDVLRAAAAGAPTTELARRLFLSESTVRNYLSAAIAKTGTRNRTEAVHVAEANGWLY
jgi:two-component system, NarL family, response regulator DesR